MAIKEYKRIEDPNLLYSLVKYKVDSYEIDYNTYGEILSGTANYLEEKEILKEIFFKKVNDFFQSSNIYQKYKAFNKFINPFTFSKIANTIKTSLKNELLEINTLKKCMEALEKNIPLRRVEFEDAEKSILKNFSFITYKPIIYVANVNEEDVAVGKNKYTEKVMEYAGNEDAGVIVMCARIEEELALLEDEERQMFMEDIGIKSSGLDKLIFATYDLLGLATFFTSGTDECRAWTFKNGMKAPSCAGLIHTDFEKGFIKAEVMSFDDFKTYGSEIKVKEAGRVRLEGKEYLVQDGDIIYFRFNV